ncbi:MULTISPECIES: DUF1493 family protein [Rahnella]|jgi:hypothetical protein|uniref:DUF1493 family protein n=1 Tax=Rahnella contaminans TaxID=2703882 RepID=A0A6M2AZY9_9GAMM|nr:MULTISPECIES: DUF1493 family protein [Rahnella]MBU9823102.1 DUF1493 family protein [Rahnella sp. BCC 1045]MCS3422567.1 hypothetical protein [Rahnella sp. BIGb0603]MDF1893999.1 DUF1493 family protein [Rahnella contaminans]NGX85993.1 DUF1493 family protein [Rahnella contaminans]
MDERDFETEICEYLTKHYGFRKSWRDPEIVPVQKHWGINEGEFNLLPEDAEDMLLDVFTKYSVDYLDFDMLNYYEAERAFWQKKLPQRELKPLTVEMIIEAVKVGRWFYDD